MQTNARANVAGSFIQSEALKDNQFLVAKVPLGSALLVGDAAVFNVADGFCTTQAKCTHRGGRLNEGKLDGSTVPCPWHRSQYNVCTGAVLHGQATEPVKTYRVIVEGEIGRVEKDGWGATWPVTMTMSQSTLLRRACLYRRGRVHTRVHGCVRQHAPVVDAPKITQGFDKEWRIR